jgi:NTP pyrophosphatase (non-canonical NTP hydrolase)
MWIVGHLVEVLTGLSLFGTHKMKPEFSMENYVPKALAWWLSLCGAVGVRSVEELLWMKFPGVCSYCRLKEHREGPCKKAKDANRNPDWVILREMGTPAWKAGTAPKTLSDWQTMFNTIYPITQTEDYGMTFGRLSEEVGELSEAVRMFGASPSTFISEAADVFAWLMHFVGLYEARSNSTINLSELLYRKYPDRCSDCNQYVCKCPPTSAER